METKQTEQRARLMQQITDAVADYRDGAIPATVAVDGTVLAVMGILDGDDTQPGYVVFPKIDPEEVVLGVIRRIDETGEDADQNMNLSGNLSALFKGINS